MKLLRNAIVLAVGVTSALAQQSKIYNIKPRHYVPEYVRERLSATDKVLFEKLSRVSIEGVWAELRSAGYDQNFINELTPLHTNRRLIGRAQTIRYLPNRPDIREENYSKRKQLNYVSAEETEPGDVLVLDASGETRSAVPGDVTTTRFLYRGGAGMVIDGSMRDVRELEQMHMQV